MEITSRQIQLIQDVYGNAKSMRRQIADGEENVNELSEIEYARSQYWDGIIEGIRSVFTILGI